jgi:hypothetical protein
MDTLDDGDEDDENDVIIVLPGSSTINDEFDEILVKTKRSQSVANLNFSRPLTGDPRRRRRQSAGAWYSK